jgi:hypothetical protein
MVVIVAVLLLGIPSVPTASAQPAPSAPLVTLAIKGVAATETPNFWAVDVDGLTDSANSVEAALLNDTPIKTLRYGANWIDGDNWTTGCYYNNNNICSPVQGEPTTFASLCQWLHDQCILGVPAETNNPSAVTAMVHWLATQTSWTPTCWALGNEPDDWTHFNIPWSRWSSDDRSTPTSAQFAADAANLTGAIRHIYPKACIVGIENNDNVRRTTQWTEAVVDAAPNVTEVAIHSYPDNHCTGPYLSTVNLTSLARQYEDAVGAAQGLPVDTQEFNIGLGQCPAQGTETAAVMVSASAAQALELGMPQFGYFRFDCPDGLDCMINSTHNILTPVYQLYSQLFTHLDIRTVRNVSLSGPYNPETYAAEGSDNATDSSLLLSNAATTGSENISLAGVSPSNWTGEVYIENTKGVVSRILYEAGMTVSLPPESTMVVKMWAPRSSDFPVKFTESGLPSGTNWSVTLNGVTNASTTGAVEFTAPDGSYSFLVGSVSAYSATPPSGIVTVSDGGASQSVTFTATAPALFPVTFTETGLPGESEWSVLLDGVNHGSLTPTIGFRVENGTYTYTVEPVSGFTVNGTSGSVTVDGLALNVTTMFEPDPKNQTGNGTTDPTNTTNTTSKSHGGGANDSGNSTPGGGRPPGPGATGSGPETTLTPTRVPVEISLQLGATLVAMTAFALALSAGGAVTSARRAKKNSRKTPPSSSRASRPVPRRK